MVGLGGGEAFALLLQIIGIVAAKDRELLAVEFENGRTDVVEEVAVVGDEEQGAGSVLQVLFEPERHVEVEMVGRLVEDQQVGLGKEHVGQRHALHLPAGKRADGLVEIADIEFRENLRRALLEVPSVALLHFRDERVEPRLLGQGKAFLVAANERREFARLVETGLGHGHRGVVVGRLAEEAHARAVAHDDAALFVVLAPRKNVEERRFARAVAGDEGHLLPFVYGETHVVEQFQCAEALGEMLHVKKWCHIYIILCGCLKH